MISFPKGTYHIYPNRCHEAYIGISNHDSGLKRIAFPLKGLSNVTIEGSGSLFLFHGRVMPFMVECCRNITIRNLEIDYARPFFTQGEVLEASHEQVTLRIDPEEYPFEVRGETIYFQSPGEWESSYIKWFIEFDPVRSAPTYGMGDSNLRDQRVQAEQLARDIVRFRAPFRQLHTVGHIVNITHEKRYNPGLFIHSSEEVQLEHIRIYHAGAMGVIGQCSKQISLQSVHIGARSGSGRVVSANNDATHFVNCEGKILIEDCTFEHQLDDGTNIHGIYNPVSRIYPGNRMDLELMHEQQQGVCVYRRGDRIAVVDPRSQLHRGYATVIGAELVNRQYIHLEAEPDAGIAVQEGDVIENVTRMPAVEIRGCNIGDNRARGLLISTHQGAIVEDCTFYTSGTSIICGGNLNKWYESGAARNITIRRNLFHNCGYGAWGEGHISMRWKNSTPEASLHANIRIVDNSFYTFHSSIVIAAGVRDLTITGNQVRKSNDFKPFAKERSPFDLQHCQLVTIADNSLDPITEKDAI